MYSKRFSVVTLLASFVLLLGLAAGCGEDEGSAEQTSGPGGGDTATDSVNQQESAGESTGSEVAGGTTDGDRPQIRIALGTIESVDPETRALELTPVEGEPMTFRISPEARIAVDAQQAELSDLSSGQQAQVRYVVRDDLNRARTVRAFSDGG